MTDALGGQKREADPLGLELHVTVSRHIDAQTPTLASTNAVRHLTSLESPTCYLLKLSTFTSLVLANKEEHKSILQ